MQELKTVVCFLLALFTALACMFFTKLVNQRLHKVF
jgi:hypothetical protein